jgi:hypothetical protein
MTMTEPLVEEQPPMARDARVGMVLHEATLWGMQMYDDLAKEWVSMGAFKSDRDEMQLVQDFHARKHPEDRRRLVEIRTTYTVVEIEKPNRMAEPEKEPAKKETSA